MSKFLFTMTILAAAGAWLATALPAAGADDKPANLLVNGDFEKVDSKTDKPVNWVVVDWNPKETQGTASLESVKDAHGGEFAVKVVKTGGPNIVVIPKLTATQSGKHHYKLSFYYKAPAGGHVFCSFLTADADKKRLQYEHKHPAKPTKPIQPDEWAQLDMDFTSDAKTASLAVYLRTDATGTLFDDAVLEEVK